MKNIQLINGRYSPNEASCLLKDLLETNFQLHGHTLRTNNGTEEDVAHYERKLGKTEEELRNAVYFVKNDPEVQVDIEAFIQISIKQKT